MYNYGNPGRGIDRSFPENSSGSSGLSSASVATTTGTTQQQQQKYSVAGSSQFVPSLNAITSNQSLQWMLQPSIGTPGPPRPLRSSYPLPPGIPATMNPPQPSQSHLSRPGVIRAAAAIGSTTRRNDEYLSPDELERRRIRRERNKMAAAKCRNRRRELTDTLQNETDQLEDEKSHLQKEIADLQKEKEKLELVFEAHRPICKVQESDSDSDSSNDIPTLSGIKIEPVDPDLPGPSGVSKHYVKLNKPKPKITIPPTPSVSSITDIPLESEALHTPVVISTPSLTPFTASLVFSYPSSSLDTSSQALNLVTSHPSSQNPQPCAVAHRRSSSSGDQSDHSLNSPTILTL